MTAEEYLSHTGHAFFHLHNPGDYPLEVGNSQEQALGNDGSGKNQALFWRCTDLDGAIKKEIFMAVQQVFLSPIMYQLTGFGEVTALDILQHLFRSYGAIEKSTSRKIPSRWWDHMTRITPFPNHRPTQNMAGICKIRSSENFLLHDGVKMYHPVGTNGNVQQRHQVMAPKI